MSLLTLYCLLLSLCRVYDITSSIVVGCGGWLQRLPAVCEKCYFLLAEVRKKQKMFSHTRLGARLWIGWCRLFIYLFIYLASPIITQSNNTYTQQFLSNPKTRKQRPCLCLKHESKLTKNMHPWPAHVASATLDKNAHTPTRSLRTFSLLGAVDIYITKLLSNFYVNNVITLQSCVWLAMLVVIVWIKVKLAANGVRISISSTPTSSDDILDTFFNIEFIYILNADKLF
jgi:hypothetical protein